MGFQHPEWLWLMLLLPALALGYGLRLRALPGCGIAALRRAPGWQRHLAPSMLLLAAGLLLVAAAGPTVALILPVDQRTLVLALDVSGSMQAQDVQPTRLAASQAAAKTLIERLPPGVRVAVVSYADSAQLVQPPSARHADAIAAVDRIRLAGGTAIGDGIVCALAAIFPDQHLAATDPVITSLADRTAPERTRVPPGSYRSAAIVLLSDGQNSAGADPLFAARMAAERGVKVYTVGFGTEQGVILGVENASVWVRLDETGLRRIADETRGEYFRASSGHELDRVYEGLQARLGLAREQTEVTALFAAAAALIVVLGAGLSLAWFGRIA